MKILALEFSSEQRSVAVVEGRAGASSPQAAAILGSASELGGRSTRAFTLIERALEQAGIEREAIDCIAIGIGPGSYTGIRAAIALAQGWELARGIKLLGISSVEVLALDCLAQGIRGAINIAIDAQRNEFYLARYELDSSNRRAAEELHLAPAAELEKRGQLGEMIVGPDSSPFGGQQIFPSASSLGQIAAGRSNFVSGELIEPIYLRETAFVKAPPPRVI